MSPKYTFAASLRRGAVKNTARVAARLDFGAPKGVVGGGYDVWYAGWLCSYFGVVVGSV